MYFDPEDIKKSKDLAWLSYIGFFFMVPLLIRRESPYTKMHVNQGIFLFFCEIALFFVQWIPAIRYVAWALELAVLLLAVWGIVRSVQGLPAPMPLIGRIKIIRY